MKLDKKLSELTKEDIKNLISERFSKEDLSETLNVTSELIKKVGKLTIEKQEVILNFLTKIEKITNLSEEELEELLVFVPSDNIIHSTDLLQQYVFSRRMLTNQLLTQDCDDEEIAKYNEEDYKKKEVDKQSVFNVPFLPKKNVDVALSACEVLDEHERPFWLGALREGIYDAICTIYEEGNMRFTTEDVIRKLCPGSKITNQRIMKYQKYIESLKRIQIRVICEDVYKLKKIDDKHFFKGSLLNLYCDEIQDKKGIYRVKYWYFATVPLLKPYRDNIKQLDTFKNNILNIPGVNSTDNNLSLVLTLRKRISTIKNKKSNKKKYSNVIILFNLFEEAKINIHVANTSLAQRCENTIDRKKKQRAIEIVKKTLDHWQKVGLIEKYEFNKQGNSIISVTVY